MIDSTRAGLRGLRSAKVESAFYRAVDPKGPRARRPRPVAHCVFCTADDLLPEKRKTLAEVTDAEVVTLCVAQQ